MKYAWTLLVGVWLLGMGASGVQAQAPSTGVQLDDDVRVLRLADTLDLTQDQLNALQPLLKRAQEALIERDKRLDEAWKSYGDGVTAANTAGDANRLPDGAAKTQADAANKAHDDIMGDTHQALLDAANDFVQALSPDQRSRIEAPRDADLRQASIQRFHGAPSMADYMAREVAVLRRLLPDEYATVRVPMAMRLSLILVTIDDAAFAGMVSQLLGIEDTVRRMTDAEFTRYRPQLPSVIAQALRLPPTALGGGGLITEDEIISFFANPRTVEILSSFKPTPAQPAPGAQGGE
jgi:hypothetical protein